MQSLIHFMNTWVGRLARIALGLALIYAGLVVLGGTAGLLVAVIGLLPLVMGIVGRCLLQFVFPQPKQV